MANPMLNDKSLEKASTWGPGSAASADTMTQWPPPPEAWTFASGMRT